MRLKAYPGEDQDTLKSPDAVATKIVEMLAADYAETGGRISLSR